MQTLYDRLVRHQIYLQRYGKRQERQLSMALKVFLRKAKKTLSQIPADQLSEASLKNALQLILKEHSEMMDKLIASLNVNLVELSKYEVQFNARALQDYVNINLTTPSPEQVTAGFYFSKMQVSDGKYFSVKEVLDNFNAHTKSKVAKAVADGYTQGLTTPEIAKALDTVVDLQRHNTMTLARTMTNHTAANARKIFMDENADVLEGYQWVATLDSRTSLLCGGLDGKNFSFNDTQAPMPPSHYNCRSTIIPLVKAEYSLGNEIPSTRVSQTGQVNSKTTYENWLKKQPKAFQDDILGKEKAEIFRRGGVSLDKFVDEKGQSLSLEQLKKLDNDLN